MYKLVLIRHGQSEWNLSNQFTGWADVDLTDKGVQEAKDGGRLLKAEGYSFDMAYTSVQKRAIKTLHYVLEEMNELYIPEVKDWHLNERHYGALQGLDKSETAEKYGADQVKIWRRSYDTPPPALDTDSEHYPGNDARYAHLSEAELPRCESLKDTVARVVPYFNAEIAPQIKAGKKLIIAAHGNSLRALVQYLNDLSQAEVLELNIPTGQPLVFELDADLKPIKHYYLGDADAIAAAAAAVAAQGAAK